MATTIVFRYEEMQQAIAKLEDLAQAYASAANKFEQDFTASISDWEGDSKDKMLTFISGPVTEYTANSVPQMIRGLAELLRYNVKQMEDADRQISESIPASLQ